jgi:hypothetical protein
MGRPGLYAARVAANILHAARLERHGLAINRPIG